MQHDGLLGQLHKTADEVVQLFFAGAGLHQRLDAALVKHTLATWKSLPCDVFQIGRAHV